MARDDENSYIRLKRKKKAQMFDLKKKDSKGEKDNYFQIFKSLPLGNKSILILAS